VTGVAGKSAAAAHAAATPTNKNAPATGLKSGPATTQAPVATTPGTPARNAAMAPTVTTTRAGKPAAAAAPVQPLPGPDVTPVEERVTYQYNALGRRDPFMPLVGGGYVGADEQLAPADVGGLKVVGIVWGAQDKFALVEDPRGNSSVLRKGDKVMNGTVEGLRRDAVVIKLTSDGVSELVEIPLTRKGDDNASR